MSELLGVPLSYKVLTGIIPENWKEYGYEYDDNLSVYVEGQFLPKEEWVELLNNISEEFKDKLINIYSHTPNGVHFIVYLKK